jgi:outer membrane beta-barrel protein
MIRRPLLSRAATAFIGVGLILFATLPARATEEQEEEQAAAYAVQNRQFVLGHELSASVGILPLNAFTKGITFGGAYTYHFSDLWAWEVASFHYLQNIDTDLRKELMDNFQVQPTQIEVIEYFGGSSLILKPLYGKLAWLNRSVIHVEGFLSFGGAVAKYKTPAEYRPAFEVGGGMRLYGSQRLSMRLDVREYGFFKGYDPKNELFIGLTGALSFGGGR